jgi:hypothetical protein
MNPGYARYPAPGESPYKTRGLKSRRALCSGRTGGHCRPLNRPGEGAYGRGGRERLTGVQTGATRAHSWPGAAVRAYGGAV